MDVCTRFFMHISARQRKLDELAMEWMDIHWFDNPSGKGTIDREWPDLTPAEQQRSIQIDDISDKLHEEIYKAQLLAEELLDDEQLDRLCKLVGSGDWHYNRTLYMIPTGSGDDED